MNVLSSKTIPLCRATIAASVCILVVLGLAWPGSFLTLLGQILCLMAVGMASQTIGAVGMGRDILKALGGLDGDE